jgi:hypothetical protein
MILPTLVVAYMVLAFWVMRLVNVLVKKLCKMLPKVEKYALAVTPLVCAWTNVGLVLTLQVLLCIYIFYFGKAIGAGQNLYKVLCMDVSALNIIQTIKWGVCSFVAAGIYGLVILANAKNLTLDAIPFVIAVSTLTTVFFQITALTYSVTKF